MGTNYYVKFPPKNHCDHCGREDSAEEIHIGKSSMGWIFCFNGQFESGLAALRFAKRNEEFLFDEYGQKINFDEFADLVEYSKNKHWLGWQPEGCRDDGYIVETWDGEAKVWDKNKKEVLERLDHQGYRIGAKEFC